MDSSLSQSKSASSNLTTVRRHRASISVSASYQSHFSSLGSLHRVRTASEQVSLRKDDLRVLESGLAGQDPRPRAGRFCSVKQLATDPAAFLMDDFRRMRGGHIWRPRSLVTLYCCLCVLFMTAKIHAFVRDVQAARAQHDPPWKAVEETHTGWHGTSPSLLNLTASQRLSVAFRHLSPKAHLELFVAQARPHRASDLTACLWTEDAQLEEAFASTAAWPGPVSLVVVTTHAPSSTAYAALRDRLRIASANACVHMLYVPSVAGASANTYLNVARFFAPTARVVLFPALVPRARHRDMARWLAALPADARHPVLLGNTTGRAYAPQSLTPVVLARDLPVWCTERVYLFGSRALDWGDCLWRLWLESAGGASSVAVPHLLNLDGSKNASAPSVSAYAMKLRLRWSTKYRAEACAFTLKRSQALQSLSKTEKRHTQWRKKFCRETVGPGALDAL